MNTTLEYQILLLRVSSTIGRFYIPWWSYVYNSGEKKLTITEEVIPTDFFDVPIIQLRAEGFNSRTDLS